MAAPAFVRVGGSAFGASGTSRALTVVAAGHAIGNLYCVALVLAPGTGAVACSDNRSGSNVYVIAFDTTDTVSNCRIVLFRCTLVVALVSGDTVTATHPTSTSCIGSCEYGVPGATDKTAAASGTGTAADSGNTAVTSEADELVLGILGHGADASSATLTAGTNYTVRQSVGGASSGHRRLFIEDKVVAATGAQKADGTLSASRNWAAACITIPGPAAGGSGSAAITLPAFQLSATGTYSAPGGGGGTSRARRRRAALFT